MTFKAGGPPAGTVYPVLLPSTKNLPAAQRSHAHIKSMSKGQIRRFNAAARGPGPTDAIDTMHEALGEFVTRVDLYLSSANVPVVTGEDLAEHGEDVDALFVWHELMNGTQWTADQLKNSASSRAILAPKTPAESGTASPAAATDSKSNEDVGQEAAA